MGFDPKPSCLMVLNPHEPLASHLLYIFCCRMVSHPIYLHIFRTIHFDLVDLFREAVSWTWQSKNDLKYPFVASIPVKIVIWQA